MTKKQRKHFARGRVTSTHKAYQSPIVTKRKKSGRTAAAIARVLAFLAFWKQPEPEPAPLVVGGVRRQRVVYPRHVRAALRKRRLKGYFYRLRKHFAMAHVAAAAQARLHDPKPPQHTKAFKKGTVIKLGPTSEQAAN